MADSFLRQILRFDWDEAEWMHSLLCLPGIAIPLFGGVLLGYPGTGVLMAGGAQTVGFGSFQQPLFHRSSPMIFASVGIAVSAVVGALCRDDTPALMVAAVIFAFFYAISNTVSTATAWVAQQCCTFLVVSSAAPSAPGTTHDLVTSALLRGAGVLAGAALQTGLILLLRRRFPEVQSRFSSPDFDPQHLRLQFLREQLAWGSASLQFALRMMVTAAMAVWVYRQQTYQSAYWIGMTAMLLPKPGFSLTASRSLLRITGTFAGVLLCTARVVLARPRGEVLSVLVLLFLFGSYLLVNVNYGAFALCLTGYICFLLAIVRNPPREVLAHRMMATLTGAVIVLGIHIIFLFVRKLLGIREPMLRSLESVFGSRRPPVE